MRSREFLMKDAYSFDLDADGARHSYKDVRRLSAHLRAVRPDRDSDDRRHRADRRRPQPRIHHSGVDRRERGVLPQGLSSPSRAARRHRFRRRGAMQAVFDRWTSLYAATSEKHDAAAFDATAARPRAFRRAASRSAIFSTSAPNTPAPMKAVVNGPDGKEHPVHMGSYGIGPSRLAAALIEANHDEAGIDLAGGGRAFRCRPGQSEGRRRRLRRRLQARLRRARKGGRRRRSTTTATSGRARNSRPWTSSACRIR